MSAKDEGGRSHRVCPWWIGYLLVSPLRRLFQDPRRILAPHVRPGMTVLDFGPGMGYFSLPAARLVGPTGRVVCVDLQERMLAGLARRARRAGLAGRIEARRASADDLGLSGLEDRIDFALAFAVVHEVPEPERLLRGIRGALKRDGRLLIAEPIGHVAEEAFAATIASAGRAGLTVIDRPRIRRSRTALLAPTRAGALT